MTLQENGLGFEEPSGLNELTYVIWVFSGKPGALGEEEA